MKISKIFTKGGGRMLRKQVILLLALILALGSFTTVFAAPTEGSKTTPAQAAITKILKMPVGTVTPAHTYTFTFTGGAKEDGGTAPSINSVTATFTSGDNGSEAGDVKTVKKQVTIPWAFTATGIYTYTVKETASTNSLAANERLGYSQAEYTLKVYVAEKDGTIYVRYVEAFSIKDDGGITVSGSPKVNPEPKDGVSYYSEMAFTNNYVKTNTADPDPGDNQAKGALYFEEKAEGNMSDSTLPFDVSVTITKPSFSLVTETSYKAYLVDSNGKVSSPATPYDTGQNYYTFASGTAKAIKIKHAQRLVFTDLPVGTTYLAEQTAPASYTVNATVTYGNTSVLSEITTKANTVSTSDYVFNSVARRVNDSDKPTSNVAFVNEYGIATPGGIVIDNLPFILLILLSLTALAAYVAGRLRRKGFEAC
ncbi:MAG: hypothetical protein LBK04_01755 [Clostridiales Family XIII bacterium]|jgi:hypothetical protein|nr:hypothetical protein [Clostridiales Family XIII bacterium]